MITIEAKGLYYKALNRQIREYLARGEKGIVLNNILGQRYIGGGLNNDATIKIYGTPGQDLGAFMNGATIHVFGNAQDGVGNTMDTGKIIVHGKAGEIPAHSMRGGKVFIKGDVEYRAGIHMKQYMDKIPLLIIGGTAKDYCGEYMAGGRVIILNLDHKTVSPVGNSVGTGIHGGEIYVRGKVEKHQLGIGAVFGRLNKSDREFLKNVIDEYARDLGMDISNISPDDFIKITKKGHRPFGNLYTPVMNIKTAIPVHFNMTPPCAYNCPTGIPTPVFLNLIKEGKIEEAQHFMDEYTPFRMSVCGTACPAPCMEGCSRNKLDGPVEIQKLARKYYPDSPPTVAKDKKTSTISIVGAGPSGLSAAWQLSRRGYPVNIYDATSDIGGKVKHAIPRERLANESLDRDLARIRSLPITFHTGEKIDRGKFARIYENSDIVIVSTGAHITKRIPYPGGERILSGLVFLVDINNGNPMDLSGKKIVIVGSGNVGMDIACESWRLGASKVTAIDIQKPLAFGRELDLAIELGTEIKWPKMIDRLDESKVYFKDGTDIDADIVFFSIGEAPDTSFLPESVFIDERGYIITAEASFKSSDPKVYGCGDIIKPGLISDAVGSGRLAAMEVDARLTGKDFVYPRKDLVPQFRIQAVYFGEEDSDIDHCMSCGTCIFCDKCIENCPQEAISRNGEIFYIDKDKCLLCYTCVNICPRGAIHTDVVINGKDD